MTAFGTLPQEPVEALGRRRPAAIGRAARAAGHRFAHVDLSGASDKASVLAQVGHGLGFPDYYGRNLDALYDCLTDLEPDGGAPPGFAFVLEKLPPPPGLSDAQREALLAVFVDAAQYFAERGVAMRVFYSVRR